MQLHFNSQHLPHELFRSVVENASDIILIIDATTAIQYCSPSFTRWLGYEPHDYLGQPILAFVHPDDHAECMAALARATRSREKQQPAEQRVRHKDGTWRYFESAGDSFVAGERESFITIIGRDITERKRTEHQLRKLSQAVSQSPAIILITDYDGRVEFVNPKFSEITGYTPEEVLGQNPSLWQSGKTSLDVYREMWATVKSGHEWRGELFNLKKNGEGFWVYSTMSGIRDGSGRITHFLAVQEDITEKKRIQEQIQRSQRLDNIGILAGGIAHELNNILSPIIMAAELLREENPDDASLKNIAIIYSNACRGAEIVKQVLTFARGARGEPVAVDPELLVRELVQMILRTFPKNIHVVSEFNTSSWKVKAVPTLLFQALLNLCINSRDAMPDGGELFIQCQSEMVGQKQSAMLGNPEPGPHVAFTVRDSGDGIPPEILDKIFLPFFTTKKVGKGTGLGLSSVLGIVQNHHGFLNITSQPGRGSTFTLFLPAQASGAAPAQEPASTSNLRGRNECILLVDDEPDICEVNKDTLLRWNYRILTASNGAEAVATFAKHRSEIALTLMDLKMPVMDGCTAIQSIRNLDPNAKIIASTGSVTNHALHWKNPATRPNDFLGKPYTGAELLAAITKTLGFAPQPAPA